LGGIGPDARSAGNERETDGKHDMTIGLHANYRLLDRPFHWVVFWVSVLIGLFFLFMVCVGFHEQRRQHYLRIQYTRVEEALRASLKRDPDFKSFEIRNHFEMGIEIRGSVENDKAREKFGNIIARDITKDTIVRSGVLQQGHMCVFERGCLVIDTNLEELLKHPDSPNFETNFERLFRDLNPSSKP